MKPTIRLAAFAAILPLALCSRVFALAADLTAPTLAFSPDFAGRDKVMAVLTDKQFKFLRGFYINTHTTLKYSGDAASLNAFLSRMTASKAVKISTTFEKSEEDWSWTVDHTAWIDETTLNIIINTARIPIPHP